MDREKEALDIIQEFMKVVKAEQFLREDMQKQIDKLTCEVAGLRTDIISGRAK